MKITVHQLRTQNHQDFLDLINTTKKQHSNIYQICPRDQPLECFEKKDIPSNQPVVDSHPSLTQRHLHDAFHWITPNKTIMITEEQINKGDIGWR